MVERIEIGSDLNEVMENVRSLSGSEGVVISFADGFKVKLKSNLLQFFCLSHVFGLRLLVFNIS